MEMSLFMGASIDIPNSKASRVLKDFCEQFKYSVVNIRGTDEVYQIAYDKNTNSKSINHDIYFKSNEENLFIIRFEIVRGKNEVNILTDKQDTNDDINRIVKSVSAHALRELGITVVDYDKSVAEFGVYKSILAKKGFKKNDIVKKLYSKYKAILSLVKNVRIINTINMGRINLSIDNTNVSLFLNDGNSISIDTNGIFVNDEIFEDPNYLDYFSKVTDDINLYILGHNLIDINPIKSTDIINFKQRLHNILRNFTIPKFIDSFILKPGQDVVYEDQDDNNYYYIQGPTPSKGDKFLTIGIKSKVTGKTIMIEIGNGMGKCFSLEEFITDNNISIECLSDVDEDLFKDLESYSEKIKLEYTERSTCNKTNNILS